MFFLRFTLQDFRFNLFVLAHRMSIKQYDAVQYEHDSGPAVPSSSLCETHDFTGYVRSVQHQSGCHHVHQVWRISRSGTDVEFPCSFLSIDIYQRREIICSAAPLVALLRKGVLAGEGARELPHTSARGPQERRRCKSFLLPGPGIQ